ncbi:hypothetical protein EJB05_22968 [Eragrostis curvula]|uniref:Uncharacterized protein n=1 Tax=Eragrostis curvula TaxID=38414 RepID=A0A5J9V7A0_9POAL|nr:hypothetical protein EJB05_22968 [Eragrostis curvula]
MRVGKVASVFLPCVDLTGRHVGVHLVIASVVLVSSCAQAARVLGGRREVLNRLVEVEEGTCTVGKVASVFLPCVDLTGRHLGVHLVIASVVLPCTKTWWCKMSIKVCSYSLLLPVRLRTLRIELQMMSSDQEDSPAGRPLFDRTNIETAGEHDGELFAKKREEGRERTMLCHERKKASKQKDDNLLVGKVASVFLPCVDLTGRHLGVHLVIASVVLVSSCAQAARVLGGRREVLNRLVEVEEGTCTGEHDGELFAKKREEGRERTMLCHERKKASKQKDDNLPGGKGKWIGRYAGQPGIVETRNLGFGDVVSLEIASDEFQNEVTSRVNKRGFGDVMSLKTANEESP